MVNIAEPYQQMEYERARLYKEKGIDEGLIEEFYASENAVYEIKRFFPVIVFVNGNTPTNLVFTVMAARESIKSADKIISLVKKKKKYHYLD